MAKSFKLGEDALEQIREVVQEGRARYRNGPPPAGRGVQVRAPVWQAFKPTSGPSGGIYTGSLVLWDGTTETVLAAGIKGVPALTTATLNKYYPARLVGESGGAPLYLFWRTPTGYTGTVGPFYKYACVSGSLTQYTSSGFSVVDGLVQENISSYA